LRWSILPASDPRSDQRLQLFSRRAIDRIAIESGAVFCYWMELLVKSHRRAGDRGSVGACSSGKINSTATSAVRATAKL